MTEARFRQLHNAYKKKCDELTEDMWDNMGTSMHAFTKAVFDLYHKRWAALIKRYYTQ